MDKEYNTGEELADDFLEHFGVMGMKWGVRNPETRERYTRKGNNKPDSVSKKKPNIMDSTPRGKSRKANPNAKTVLEKTPRGKSREKIGDKLGGKIVDAVSKEATPKQAEIRDKIINKIDTAAKNKAQSKAEKDADKKWSNNVDKNIQGLFKKAQPGINEDAIALKKQLGIKDGVRATRKQTVLYNHNFAHIQAKHLTKAANESGVNVSPSGEKVFEFRPATDGSGLQVKVGKVNKKASAKATKQNAKAAEKAEKKEAKTEPKSAFEKNVKTKTGEDISLTENKKSPIASALGKISSNIKDNQTRATQLSMKDKNGKKVGSVQLHKESDSELNVVWIDVKGKAQGKGIGSSALKSVVDAAKSEGFETVTLEVPGSSPDALHIYEKMGFKSKGVLSTDDAWGGLTKMELQLKPKIKHSGEDLADDYLEHHGVMGMKWGIRRTQAQLDRASQGRKTSLTDKTPRGKSRLANPNAKSVLEKTPRGKSRAKAKAEAIPKLEKKLAGQKEALAKKQNPTQGMSDVQLRETLNRMNMEKQYNQLSKGEKSAGRKIAETIFVGGATVVATEYFKEHLKKVADPLLKVGK